MIRFSCPLCGAKILAPDWKAGRRGKCAGCRQKVPVPRESEADDAAPQPAVAENEPHDADSAAAETPAPSAWEEPSWERAPAPVRAEAAAPRAQKQSPEPPALPARKMSVEQLVALVTVFCITVVLVYYATVLVLKHAGSGQEKVWPLQDLAAQFQENRALALEQFRGKQLKISSTVVGHRPALDGPVTILGAADHPVYCLPIPALAADFEALGPGAQVVFTATVSQRAIAMLPPLPPGRQMTIDQIHALIKSGALPQATEEAPGGFTLRDAQLVKQPQ